MNNKYNIKLQLLGSKHPDYATSLNYLAMCYADIGNYEEALTLYKEVVKIRLQVLGDIHPDYAASLNNLALTYVNTANYKI